jgi:hypothetical protein
LGTLKEAPRGRLCFSGVRRSRPAERDPEEARPKTGGAATATLTGGPPRGGTLARAFAPTGRTVDDRALESMGVLVSHAGSVAPSNGGVILFGHGAAREGIRALYPEALVEAYLLGRVPRGDDAGGVRAAVRGRDPRRRRLRPRRGGPPDQGDTEPC